MKQKFSGLLNYQSKYSGRSHTERRINKMKTMAEQVKRPNNPLTQ